MYCLLGRYQLKQMIGYVLEGEALQFFEVDRNDKINKMNHEIPKERQSICLYTYT